MRYLSPAWKWIGANDTQLRTLFTLIAASYVLFQYTSTVRNERVARTTDYFLSQSKDAWTAAIELQKFSHEPLMVQFYKQQKSLPAGQKSAEYAQKFPELLSRAGKDEDVLKLAYYYDGVALCVKASSCDAFTSCDYFFPSLQNFRETYRPFLERSSGDLPQAGAIGELVEKDCAADFHEYCKENTYSPFCSTAGSQPSTWRLPKLEKARDFLTRLVTATSGRHG